ncbi:MAG TPA: toxic anion resistance protein, partial [Solibacillus sp.]
MSENPLFEDLDKRNQQTQTTDIVPQQVKPLVSEQELSQIRQRQEQLKQQPQVQTLAQKIDVKNQIAVLEFGKETAQGISTFSDRMLA